MAGDTLKIDAAVDENRPWPAPPAATGALARGRGRFAAAIDRFETAIAARDVPLPAKGIA